MRPLLLAALLLAPLGAHAETILRLSESGSAQVQPNDLVASLEAQTNGASPAETQAAVNRITAAALAVAKATQGVSVSTGAYRASRIPPTPGVPPQPLWHASQSIELHSANGEAILTLVGKLQQQGLAISTLDWRVSPDKLRAAQAEATNMALRALRARATEAATQLGLSFDYFSSVDLAPSNHGPIGLMRAAAAPSAEADLAEVTATVSAEAVLK